MSGTEGGRPDPGIWLVSRRWDLWVFGGSALAALALLLLGWRTGDLGGDTPVWIWVATVVGVDVAHVWATAYRVYLDPEERARRAGLYLGVPVAAYVGGAFLRENDRDEAALLLPSEPAGRRPVRSAGAGSRWHCCAGARE